MCYFRLKQNIRFCLYFACGCSRIAICRLMFGPADATKRDRGLDATHKPGVADSYFKPRFKNS
jgi:hypothetical protein